MRIGGWIDNGGQTKMAEAIAKAWFLYVVQCADGSLYTGITNDVLQDHD